MSLEVYICDAVLEKMYLEAGFLEVFAGIADAVLCSDTAYIYVSGVKKLENFRQWLSCIVYSFKSRILFGVAVASYVKSQLFAGIWSKALMNLASSGACHAM